MQRQQGTRLCAAPQLIVAGQSVGKIKVGQTRTIIRRALGAPTHSYTRPDGYVVDQWVGPQNVITDLGPEHSSLTVLYSRSKAVQIEFNSPTFATKSKLSTRSKIRDFYRAYPHPRLTAYVYASEDREAAHQYFDVPSAGLCAQITAQDMAPAFQIQKLIVHAPGKRVIPEPKGELVPSMSPFSHS